MLPIININEQRKHNNRVAREGLDRCVCGCKYWESDRCIDCDAYVNQDMTIVGYQPGTSSGPGHTFIVEITKRQYVVEMWYSEHGGGLDAYTMAGEPADVLPENAGEQLDQWLIVLERNQEKAGVPEAQRKALAATLKGDLL